MAKLGFCGLGQMGAPMAGRLLDAGHDVTVWNRTAARAGALADRGASVAATPEEAARGADAVITMLSDPAALDEVLFGEGGVVRGLTPGSTVIDMSTVGPEAIRRVAGRLPVGVDLLDAPVRGSVPAATDGSLHVVVGGSEETFERWRPVLEVLGRPTHIGPLGAGAAIKLVNNMTVISVVGVVSEALALADGLGLDRDATLEVLAQTPVGGMVETVRQREEVGFRPNFKLTLAAKDVRLAAEAAEAAGVDLRLVPAALTWLEEADSSGSGDLDYTAITEFVTRDRGERSA
jgi:3-hydroxyisobutyrate dehydrogenase